jgi:hypothetical protein
MTRTHGHLSDDRLFEVCLDRALDAREQQHLDGCADCEGRRAGIEQLLTDFNEHAASDTDDVFPSDRLLRQQARILSRIDHEGRPGRVIAFPAVQTHQPVTFRDRPGMRWVAAAAAVGLVIGVVAGHLAHDLRATPSQLTQTAAAAPRPQEIPEPATLRAVSTTLTEEEFLGQLEAALQGTGGMALRPLDDLTPRVWEVTAR